MTSMRAKKMTPGPRRVPTAARIEVEYVVGDRSFSIAATKLGGYDILEGGKVVHQFHPGQMPGASPYGNKRLQEDAIAAAKACVEQLVKDG